MSSMRTEIKACVSESLRELLDEPLASSGFSRRRNGLVYSRLLPEAVQRIDVAFEIHPRDNRNAAAAIYPWIEISMDSVNAIAKEMVDGDETLLGDLPDTTLQEPAEFTAPKGIGARWFIYQPDSVPAAVTEMGRFFDKWTIPFLDYYASPNAICTAYGQGDERASSVLHAPALRIAAAMVVLGRYDDAQKVADKWFGKAGPRRRYRSVFEYLESGSAPA